MTLQQIPSEFPYIRGKFYFLIYQFIGMKITKKGDVVIKDLTIKTAECYGLGLYYFMPVVYTCKNTVPKIGNKYPIHDILVLQRLESVARSPVFSQLSTSLTVIRFVSTSAKFGIARVMGLCIHSMVNLNPR